MRLAGIQQNLNPVLSVKRVCVFAGSHGIAAEGVSAYPGSVTAQMVLNFLAGGAAINVLARHGNIGVHVIDVGVDGEWPAGLGDAAHFFVRKVRAGTRNALVEPAMSPSECERALEAGREQVRRAVADGVHVLGLGEMGIGNTTAAAALYCGVLGFEPELAVGRGTGVTDAGLRRKLEVVKGILRRHAPGGTPATGGAAATGSGRYWLESVGGYEMAAMTGCILEAHARRLPVVVDGFISTAAAAAAFDLEPASRGVCFFSHRSEEAAHGAALSALGAEPLLDLKMRLGEGTGAALAMHLMEAATKVLCEMATFESAAVSDAAEPAFELPPAASV
jgi:nicotinate-nucleotide--dimethylbenzimidazole phosphoribosyltransferase